MKATVNFKTESVERVITETKEVPETVTIELSLEEAVVIHAQLGMTSCRATLSDAYCRLDRTLYPNFKVHSAVGNIFPDVICPKDGFESYVEKTVERVKDSLSR